MWGLIRFIIIFFVFFIYSSFKPKEYEKFTIKNLIIYMKQLKIAYIEIVLRQAKYETSHFSSPIFKKNHNLFGMRLAKRRKTTAIGAKDHYALYWNWKKSVKDYSLWQKYRKPKCKDGYDFLKKRKYCPNKEYENKVRKVKLTKEELKLIYQ